MSQFDFTKPIPLDSEDGSFMGPIPDMYELSNLKDVIRLAMEIREDSYTVAVDSHFFKEPGHYTKTISQACEEACKRHNCPELLPLIVAALNGGWNEMDSWVNSK